MGNLTMYFLHQDRKSISWKHICKRYLWKYFSIGLLLQLLFLSNGQRFNYLLVLLILKFIFNLKWLINVTYDLVWQINRYLILFWHFHENFYLFGTLSLFYSDLIENDANGVNIIGEKNTAKSLYEDENESLVFIGSCKITKTNS